MADDIKSGIDEGGAEDPVIRAGEHALGILEGDDLIAAQHDMLANPQFAADVAWWQQKLAIHAELAEEAEPSAEVWRAILVRIQAEQAGADVTPLMPRKSRFPLGWSIGSALAGAAAAALVFYLAVPATTPNFAPPKSVPQQAQLIAQLQSEDGARSIASRVDPASSEISLRVAGLTPDNDETTAAELWVVPAGGAPRSLGFIPGDGEFNRALSAEEARLLVAGATLAVTFEARDGLPHEAPTTPILIAGQLSEV